MPPEQLPMKENLKNLPHFTLPPLLLFLIICLCGEEYIPRGIVLMMIILFFYVLAGLILLFTKQKYFGQMLLFSVCVILAIGLSAGIVISMFLH